jgi:hypothetical protein
VTLRWIRPIAVLAMWTGLCAIPVVWLVDHAVHSSGEPHGFYVWGAEIFTPIILIVWAGLSLLYLWAWRRTTRR